MAMGGVEAAIEAMVRPSWADPRYMIATSAVQMNKVTLVGLTTSVLAKADPRRFAVGFKTDGSGFGSVQVTPFQTPQNFGWTLTQTADPQWFTLFTHGAMVSMPWNAYANGNGDVLVIECYTN